MTLSKPMLRLFLVTVLFLSLMAGGSFAQASQSNSQFEPKVGQPGKDVVWVPTPEALVEKMLDMSRVTSQDVVIDLGSGDGRTVIAAARRGAKAMGIEYNPDMVDLAKRNATAAGVSEKATFMKADLFETDFSEATVVTMFLLTDINLRLRPKILDLKPGTRIVSNTFNMGDWTADQVETIPNCTSWCTALFWTVPAKVQGDWQLPQGQLRLTQTYQNVEGTLGNTSIRNGKLSGDQISFQAGSSRYTGRVNGSTIEGTVQSGANTTSFRAIRQGGE